MTARLALEVARRKVATGEERLFESCTGAVFSGKVLREGPPVGRAKSVIVEVAGRAHQTGEARFRFDDDDPLRDYIDRGFDLFGGLGRHPGMHNLFGLPKDETKAAA